MGNQAKNQNQISQQTTLHQNGTNEKWKYVERLSGAAPLFGAGFVLIYILGFIIVNTHLATFGFATFELLRGRYLGAGLSYTLAIILISLFIPIIDESIGLSKKLKRTAARLAVIIGSMLFAVTMASFCFSFLLNIANSWSAPQSKLFEISPFDFFFFAALSVLSIVNLLGIIFEKRESLAARSYDTAWAVPMFLLTVFIYAKNFIH